MRVGLFVREISSLSGKVTYMGIIDDGQQNSYNVLSKESIPFFNNLKDLVLAGDELCNKFGLDFPDLFYLLEDEDSIPIGDRITFDRPLLSKVDRQNRNYEPGIGREKPTLFKMPNGKFASID